MIPLDEFPTKKTEFNELAYIDIALYEDQASDRLAMAKARKKFIETSKSLAKYVKKIEIVNKQKIILFTSVQIEYSVKVIANSFAVDSYYNNLNGG